MISRLVFSLAIAVLAHTAVAWGNGRNDDTRLEAITCRAGKETYNVGEAVDVLVANPTLQKMYFFIGVEWRSPDGWQEVVIDISNPSSKSALLRPLKPGESQTLYWRNTLPGLLSRGEFRFSVTQTPDPTEPTRVHQSESSFHIGNHT